MPFSYCVLGAGRQGTAAAYDLARHGDARRVLIADLDGGRARAAAARVNSLAATTVAEGVALDVRDQPSVARAIAGCDVVASAVPYFLNYALTETALAARVSFCDLGGHTETVRRQHALDAEARRAGIRIIPDCGLGPGLGNNLAVYAMSLVEDPQDVFMFDAGLPRDPQPPWNYVLSFSVEGLANEYYDGITILRDGGLYHAPVFTEFEYIDFPPIGRLEAFFIAGGCSTAPWTFRGKLKTYQLKVLRYPGTFAQLKAFSDLGLFDPNPRRIAGVDIAPRQVFNTLFEPQVRAEKVDDVCLIRVQARGRNAEVTVDLVDYADPVTGFSAMERTTGWHLAIVAAMMARGETPLGATPLELAAPAATIVTECRRRGFSISAGN